MSQHNEEETSTQPEASSSQFVERRKDGSISRMRSHAGNVPVLPQTKLCPHCPAKFTRTTHLNRHLRTHTNERLHRCDTCNSQFTRSDLLTRHKRSCGDPSSRHRRRQKSCISCAESKIKCDLQQPCSKCEVRGRDCIYPIGSSSRTAHLPSRNTSLDASTIPPPSAHPTPNVTQMDFSAAMFSELLGVHDSPPHTESVASFNTFRSPTAGSDYTQSEVNYPSSYGQLNSVYSNEILQPFFSSLLCTADATMANNFSHPQETSSNASSPEGQSPSNAWGFSFDTGTSDTQSTGVQTYMAAFEKESFLDSSMFAPPMDESLGHNLSSSSDVPTFVDTPNDNELNNYPVYLFLSQFLAQIPVVHAATFGAQGKSYVLLSAMQACGALFIKTKSAKTFVKNILQQARDPLITEFAKNPPSLAEQTDLVVAVVLLQTIGLFHQNPGQRSSSFMYHSLLIKMIRRNELVQRTASWKPPNLDETPLETAWQDWARHETLKRALILSYLHDCCHTIYFGLSPSYIKSEFDFILPCEEALWKASTAGEWRSVLENSSEYGTIHQRLAGARISMARMTISGAQSLDMAPTVTLNPFSHFVLIHSILNYLATQSVSKPPDGLVDETTLTEEEKKEHVVFAAQLALHNWLRNWNRAPEITRTGSHGLPFVFDPLPFYWLGQISLMAYQEGTPPYDAPVVTEEDSEKRFLLVKQWLKLIRSFLQKDDQTPTLFWDELMRIRLQSTQPVDDQDGLLSFFPSD